MADFIVPAACCRRIGAFTTAARTRGRQLHQQPGAGDRRTDRRSTGRGGWPMSIPRSRPRTPPSRRGRRTMPAERGQFLRQAANLLRLHADDLRGRSNLLPQ